MYTAVVMRYFRANINKGKPVRRLLQLVRRHNVLDQSDGFGDGVSFWRMKPHAFGLPWT